MARVFISYRHLTAETELARAIREHLLDLNHDVFLDLERIRVGERWNARIQEELERAEFLIALVSREFLRSRFILQHELGPALQRLAAGSLSLLPFSIGNRGDVPRGFESLDAIQFIPWREAADTPRVLAEIASRMPVSDALIRGARSFVELNAQAFAQLGRGELLARFLVMMDGHSLRHMLVHGVSGAGKTSFVRAGVAASFQPGQVPVLELRAETPEVLAQATEGSPRFLILDQFEQSLNRVSASPGAARALDTALLRAFERVRVVFCIRDEYRTAFDTLLPGIAPRCHTFPLLPFSTAEATVVLTRLLDNGRVSYDAEFIARVCENVAEGVPRTVLPAILQVIAQECRERDIALSSATWPHLVHGNVSIFEEHVRERVLHQMPERFARLDATRTLHALTAGEVKSSPKSVSQIAEDTGVHRSRVQQTLDTSSGPARVVSVEPLEENTEQRYRLTHDLFVGPVRRLHQESLRRRERWQRRARFAVLAAAAIVSFAFFIRSELARRDMQREAARREFTAAVGEFDDRDAAALLAASAFTSAARSDENRPTYAFAALHHIRAGPIPVLQPQTGVTPRFARGIDSIVLEGERELLMVDPATGRPADLPDGLDFDSPLAVTADGRRLAGYFRRARISTPFLIEITGDEIPPEWEWSVLLEPLNMTTVFSDDGGLLVSFAGTKLEVADGTNGSLLQTFESTTTVRDAAISLARGRERAAIAYDNRLDVVDLRSGRSVASVPLEGRALSVGISENGLYAAAASWRSDAALDLTLLDITARTTRSRTEAVRAGSFTIHDVSNRGRQFAGVLNGDTLLHFGPDQTRTREIGVFHESDGGSRDFGRRMRFVRGDSAIVTIAGHDPQWDQSEETGTVRQPLRVQTFATDSLRLIARSIELPADVTAATVTRDRRKLRAALADNRVVEWPLDEPLDRLANVEAAGSVSRIAPLWTNAFVVDQERLVSVVETTSGTPRVTLPPEARVRSLPNGWIAVWHHLPEESRIAIVHPESGELRTVTASFPVAEIGMDPSGTELRFVDGFSSWAGAVTVKTLNLKTSTWTRQSYLVSERYDFVDATGEFIIAAPNTGYAEQKFTFVVWELASGARPLIIRGDDAVPAVGNFLRALLRDAALERDGAETLLVTCGSAEFRIRTARDAFEIENVTTGRPVAIPRPAKDLDKIALGSRGKYAIAYGEGGAQVWDLELGAPVTPVIRDAGEIAHAALIEDDTILALATADGSFVRVFLGDATRLRDGGWLMDLVRAATGKRLDTEGYVVLTSDELMVNRSSARRKLAEAAKNDPNAAWARRIFGQ